MSTPTDHFPSKDARLLGRLEGRRALVTGGTKGIGRATAQRLLDLGCEVIIVARDANQLAETAVALGPSLTIVQADIGTDAGRDAIERTVAEQSGVLDILVNNAGMNIRKPTADYANDEAARVMSVNYDAAFDLCRRLQPALLRGTNPAIVNVSSVAAVRSMSTGAPYTASKAALDQLTRYLAVEWAPTPNRPGIRVNSVQPAYIDTPLAAPVFANKPRYEQILAATPMRRVGKPEEVAAAIAFLASDDASYITGATLPVDGGMLSGML